MFLSPLISAQSTCFNLLHGEQWKVQERDFGDGKKGKDWCLQQQLNPKLAEMDHYYNQSYFLLKMPR